MKRISEAFGQQLVLSSAHAIGSAAEHVVFAGAEPVARFAITDWLGSALVESGDGCWRFVSAGFLRSKLMIYSSDSALELGCLDAAHNLIQLADGRGIIANVNLWRTRAELLTVRGEPLVQYTNPSLYPATTVELGASAAGLRELPWVVLLGYYVLLVLRIGSPDVSEYSTI